MQDLIEPGKYQVKLTKKTEYELQKDEMLINEFPFISRKWSIGNEQMDALIHSVSEKRDSKESNPDSNTINPFK